MSCYNTSYNYYQNAVSFIFNGFFSSRLLIRDKNLYYKDFNEKHSAFVYHDVIMQTFSKHAQQYVVCESKAPRAHNYWPVLVGLLLGHCWAIVGTWSRPCWSVLWRREAAHQITKKVLTAHDCKIRLIELHSVASL